MKSLQLSDHNNQSFRRKTSTSNESWTNSTLEKIHLDRRIQNISVPPFTFPVSLTQKQPKIGQPVRFIRRHTPIVKASPRKCLTTPVYNVSFLLHPVTFNFQPVTHTEEEKKNVVDRDTKAFRTLRRSSRWNGWLEDSISRHGAVPRRRGRITKTTDSAETVVARHQRRNSYGVISKADAWHQGSTGIKRVGAVKTVGGTSTSKAYRELRHYAKICILPLFHGVSSWLEQDRVTPRELLILEDASASCQNLYDTWLLS